ncbi:hypothetical protein [Helicobacter pullorum]|nr:hypothetical protein [Helicobacter pullorum]
MNKILHSEAVSVQFMRKNYKKNMVVRHSGQTQESHKIRAFKM